MEGPVSEVPVEASPLPGRLDAFLDALDAQGLVVDISQRVRLNGMLLRLGAERRIPDDLDALCRLITPVLAGSATEQALCGTIFRTVFAGNGSGSQRRSGPTDTDGGKDHVRARNWSTLTWLARGLMGGTLAIVIAAAVYLTIVYGGLWHNDHWVNKEATLSPLGPTPVAMKIAWLNNYPVEELNPPRQSPWNRTWRWYYTEYTAAKWSALLLPWVVCAGFLAWLYHRLLAYLRREGLMQNLRSLEWRFGSAEARFGDRKLIGELQPLRRLGRTYVRVLDHERTAIASAEAAGQLRPQFTEVAVPTDFVVLIDRQSSRDHLAHYNMGVVRTLRDAGLSMEILEFNGDPTLCHFTRVGEFLRLDALVRRFPDSIIVIFATAEQLIDPVRQRLLPAVLALKGARRAILLTPDSGGAETPLERQISRRLGTTILRTAPVDVGDVVRLLVGIGGTAGPNRGRGPGYSAGVGPLMELMAARPERWMQKVGPRPQERRQLQELLRRAIGASGLRWLAATTVYPELHWPLTLSLKSAVGSSLGARRELDANLLAVSRLSWFRCGWMPDWARSLLQQMLSEDETKRVRRLILEAIGLGTRRSARNDPDLQIRLAETGDLPAHRFKADSIMLDYLLPALRSSRRLFALPEEWTKRLARKRLRRLTGVSTLAVVVAGGVSIAAISLLPIDDCDLYAASPDDPLRIGPGTYDEVLEYILRERAHSACLLATKREPENARFWLQLTHTTKKSDPAGLDYLIKAEKLNYPAAINDLGVAYAIGNYGLEITHKGEEIGLKYINHAIELGNWPSIYNLAMIQENIGDFTNAIANFRKYIDYGGEMTYQLAEMYKNGIGVKESDIGEYIRLLQLGARRGDPDSTENLGFEYLYGRYLSPDWLKADRYFKLSVRLGARASSAREMATNYRSRAMPEDLERATYWFIFAAKLGDPYAIHNLFQLIENGEAKFKSNFAPPPDFDPTVLLQAAANAGIQPAQFDYASRLEEAAMKGDATATLDEALSWYRKGAANGDDDAKRALKRLNVSETE